MLKKLLRLGDKTTVATPPSVPEGQRVYAIGDIHGCLDQLKFLIDRIDTDDAARAPAETHIVFLGDLMDRGPDSRGVIDLVAHMASTRPNIRMLMGNHEEVYLKAASGSQQAVRFFCRIGGRETILSYDIDEDEYCSLDMEELTARLPTLIPKEHIDFIQGFEEQVIFGDYLFVHAGIRPGVPLDQQHPKDMRWIREEFIAWDKPHDKFVIHGHTITDDVDEQTNRIGIDTGAFAGGTLTAIGLEGTERWFLNAPADITKLDWPEARLTA